MDEMKETVLVRGTTPLIKYSFGTLDVEDIAIARLVIKQDGTAKITKDLDDATIGQRCLQWVLTQTDTRGLTEGKPAVIYLDWLTDDGVRGIGKTLTASVSTAAIDNLLPEPEEEPQEEEPEEDENE